MIPDWLVGVVYVVGIAHAVPAWFYGKAAGLRLARRIMDGEA